MKKSNLLLIAALAVLLVSLASYNVALKAEYRKGTYKDPFLNFQPLNIQGFQAIDIQAGSPLSVRILPGPFKVWVHEKNKAVQVKKAGNRLKIDLPFTDIEAKTEQVTITCPQISEITASGFYRSEPKNGGVGMKQDPDLAFVNIMAMNLDSLNLHLDQATVAKLVNNKIGKLRSVTGISPQAQTRLEIEQDNIITEADLVVQGKSKLTIHAAKIGRLRYEFGNSTEVTISGPALGLLKQ